MSYPGGKGGCYQHIINQILPHGTFVSAFLGRCAVMRHIRPAARMVGLDKDPKIIREWKRSGFRGHFHCVDAIEWLATEPLHSDAFVYCDPPYLIHRRARGRAQYDCEMSLADHERLLTVLTKLSVPVAISGYWSELYADMLQGWRFTSFTAQTRAGGPAVEFLWMNYGEPGELHDYRFLGADYRERERIRRKAERWRKNLASMPRLERLAVWSAMREVVEK